MKENAEKSSNLNVLIEACSEIEVETSEVHLSEVFPVVHVEKVVDVRCPTDVVSYGLFIVPKYIP